VGFKKYHLLCRWLDESKLGVIYRANIRHKRLLARELCDISVSVERRNRTVLDLLSCTFSMVLFDPPVQTGQLSAAFTSITSL
jgi:hypothetical protein